MCDVAGEIIGCGVGGGSSEGLSQVESVERVCSMLFIRSSSSSASICVDRALISCELSKNAVQIDKSVASGCENHAIPRKTKLEFKMTDGRTKSVWSVLWLRAFRCCAAKVDMCTAAASAAVLFSSSATASGTRSLSSFCSRVCVMPEDLVAVEFDAVARNVAVSAKICVWTVLRSAVGGAASGSTDTNCFGGCSLQFFEFWAAVRRSWYACLPTLNPSGSGGCGFSVVLIYVGTGFLFYLCGTAWSLPLFQLHIVRMVREHALMPLRDHVTVTRRSVAVMSAIFLKKY
eukprot:SAG11_NODE_3353_length_2506_cov_1.520980_3_plen_289_part_00